MEVLINGSNSVIMPRHISFEVAYKRTKAWSTVAEHHDCNLLVHTAKTQPHRQCVSDFMSRQAALQIHYLTERLRLQLQRCCVRAVRGVGVTSKLCKGLPTPEDVILKVWKFNYTAPTTGAVLGQSDWNLCQRSLTVGAHCKFCYTVHSV